MVALHAALLWRGIILLFCQSFKHWTCRNGLLEKVQPYPEQTPVQNLSSACMSIQWKDDVGRIEVVVMISITNCYQWPLLSPCPQILSKQWQLLAQSCNARSFLWTEACRVPVLALHPSSAIEMVTFFGVAWSFASKSLAFCTFTSFLRGVFHFAFCWTFDATVPDKRSFQFFQKQ